VEAAQVAAVDRVAQEEIADVFQYGCHVLVQV
jgi:hypothetical protein